MNIHPKFADHKWIHDTFADSDFEWYYVGGCVRDFVLGRTPKDHDIATDARPDAVMALFKRHGHNAIATGEAFGGVTVVGPTGERIEVTTYRSDGPGRKPQVTFAKTLAEDLARRDLTINSMAQQPITGEIIDPFGGQGDIHYQMIRCVGDANERFAEDPLRILRAARFSAQLGFTISIGTVEAMTKHAESIRSLPVERIREEIMKAHAGRDPILFWVALQPTGILPIIVPEMQKTVGMPQNSLHHKHNVYDHSVQALNVMTAFTKDPLLRLIVFMHDIGKPATRAINPKTGQPTFINHEDVGAELLEAWMTEMKFPNEDIRRARILVKHHLVPYTERWSNGTIRRWVEGVAPYWDDLMMLRRADLRTHETPSAFERERLLGHLELRVIALRRAGEHVPPKLAITGDDVMRLLGIPAGPKVGAVLKQLRESVTDDPELNTREHLEVLVLSR